jgi:hypothetical protein
VRLLLVRFVYCPIGILKCIHMIPEFLFGIRIFTVLLNRGVKGLVEDEIRPHPGMINPKEGRKHNAIWREDSQRVVFIWSRSERVLGRGA